ncbi:SDH family Clp fold serine proteinase [Ancylobacter mangrovi]|uniref:SDH family Clp fold serine proteinase n=1 Tax=Ancylobacter mangrovi TaxID=2972472 RepID=UPI002163FBB1|nr:hypothetical protein [Ancylobacter mangrovi]MCS0501637.1 hypothetical protein [Ancylobacter mangrovi]
MSNFDIDRVISISLEISKSDNCDIFLYNGDIERGGDLEFIEAVHANKRNSICRLILVTSGGDPDAAYKMARYLQDRYDRFELILGGLCKSAGTLIAIGAHELIFSPYGELGPLDVQVAKEDKLNGYQSGLNISAALQAMESRAIKAYLRLIGDIMRSSSGVVSFQTASKSASDVLSSLYGPIFARIDPEDLGSRSRSMRIAADYGKRLDAVSENMKDGAVGRLAETYPSHGFVIDMAEAEALFVNVRTASSRELELIEALGPSSRWPTKDSRMICLSADQEEDGDETEPEGGDERPQQEDGEDSPRAGEPAGAPSGSVRRAGRRQRSATSEDLRPATSNGTSPDGPQ